MAIIGFRPPTEEEVQNAITLQHIPSTASRATMFDGSVIFYDLDTVNRLYPDYAGMLPNQKLVFLDTMPGGVISKVPLQVLYGPDVPSVNNDVPTTPSNPVSFTSSANIPITNLASFIDINKSVIDRSYVRNSMQTLEGDSLTFRNISNNVVINVKLTPAPGVVYTPVAFTLNPTDLQAVAVTFDAVEINKLPEGVSTLASTFLLSSPTLTTPEPPVIIIPPVPDPPVVPTPPLIEPPWKPRDGTPWIPEGPPQLPPVEPPVILPPFPTFPFIPVESPEVPAEPTLPEPPPIFTFPEPIVDNPGPIEQPPTNQPGTGGGGGSSAPTELTDDGSGNFIDRFTQYFT